MIFVLLLTLCAAASLEKKNSINKYVEEQKRTNQPIDHDHLFSLEGEMYCMNTLYVLCGYEGDDHQRFAQSLSDGGHVFFQGSLEDLITKGKSLEIIKSVVDVYKYEKYIHQARIYLSNLIECYEKDAILFYNKLGYLFTKGMRFTNLDVVILEQLGYSVEPHVTRSPKYFDLLDILSVLKKQSIDASLPFVRSFLQGWREEKSASTQTIMCELYEMVNDRNGDWINCIKELGVLVDENMLISAVHSSSGANVQNVWNEKPVIVNGFKLSEAFGRSDLDANLSIVQEVFTAVLDLYSPDLNRYDRYWLGKAALSRPPFLHILKYKVPAFFADFHRLWDHFVEATWRDFEGPDLFLEISELEIGNWYIETVNPHSYCQNVVTALRYIKHRGLLNTIYNQNGYYALHVLLLLFLHNDHVDLLPMINEFINAGANVNLVCPHENNAASPLDTSLQLKYCNEAVRTNLVSLLLLSGAESSNLSADAYEALCREMWNLCFRWLILGFYDEESMIYEYTGGSDVLDAIIQSVLSQVLSIRSFVEYGKLFGD